LYGGKEGVRSAIPDVASKKRPREEVHPHGSMDGDFIGNKFRAVGSSSSVQRAPLSYAFPRNFPPNPPSNPINLALRDVHEILKFEYQRHPSSVGSAVFGLDGVHQSLRAFKEVQKIRGERVGAAAGHRTPLHVFTADVNSAYDTINQDRLLEFVAPTFRESTYVLKGYSLVRRVRSGYSDGKPFTSFRRKRAVFPSLSAMPNFTQFALELAASTRAAVFSDFVIPQCVPREEALGKLVAHVVGNLVASTRTPNLPPLLRQSRGIPQGSILSSILCNLYLGAVEARVLLPRTAADLAVSTQHSMCVSDTPTLPSSAQNGLTLLMRLTDDFLVASECPLVAESLARATHAGVPELNVSVNLWKTQTTFPLSELQCSDGSSHSLPSIPQCDHIKWCGLQLNPLDGTVSASLDRYSARKGGVGGSVPFSFPSRAPSSLLSSIKVFLRPKCHAVFLDGALNPLCVVARNVFELCAVAAAKAGVLLRRWRARGIILSPTLLLRTVTEAVAYLWAMIRARAPSRTSISPLPTKPPTSPLGAASPWWLQPPLKASGDGLLVVGPNSIASLGVGGSEAGMGPTFQANATPSYPHARVRQSFQAHCPLRKKEIEWLAIEAFSRLFSRLSWAVAGGVIKRLKLLQREIRLGEGGRWIAIFKAVAGLGKEDLGEA